MIVVCGITIIAKISLMPNAQLGDKGTIYQCRTCCQNSDENFDYAAALGRLNVAARQAQE